MPKKTQQDLFAWDEIAAPTTPVPASVPLPQDAAVVETIATTDIALPLPTADEPLELKELGKSKVWAVDAMSLIFQVFHAVPEMSSPAGQPVNAVFGFTRDILTILEQKKPDYFFVGFDLNEPTFRHEMYPEYKGQRSEMPADLIPQIPLIRRMLEVLDIPILEHPRYEADDLLATLAHQVDAAGGECVLVTADKDYRQLITERTKLYNMRKNQAVDAAVLLEEWGIRPDQVVDYQTLVGDPVDNVPGVPLIGPKIAKELLQQFDTLDNIFANIDKVAGAKRKENLTNGQTQAAISRQLVRLDTAVPVEIPWEQGFCSGFHPQHARELFEELGFHSLTSKMRGEELRKKPVRMAAKYTTIDTPEQLAALAAELATTTRLSIDTETTNVNPRWAELVGISLSWIPGEACYIPIRAPAGDPQLEQELVLNALKPVLENPAIEKIGQNLKYDWILLRGAGIDLRGVAFDTMVASYLLDAGERNHNMDELAARYLNHKTTTISELIGTGKNQKRMDEVPVPLITHYAAEDADVPLRLYPLLIERLEKYGLTELNKTLEVPLIEVLAEIEFNGIRIDTALLGELSVKYAGLLAKLEIEIYDLAGRQFNIASPKQLQEILFVEQKLPILKRTKTGPSTDVEVLEELALQHALPAKIIEFRQFAKLKNTYVDSLPLLICPKTNRVHASFNQVVAATGRLSSSDPNLQNIPIRTEAGREIRAAFLPAEDDWKLIAADYSQIELRVLAHYTQDEALIAAFERDDDIHALVASGVYSVPLAEVTSAQRRVAKAVNFGIIYGQSPYGLARALDLEQSVAAQYIDAYVHGYPGVERWMTDVLRECAKQGYVTTILGRRRAISGVREPNENILQLAPSHPSRQKNLSERTAINTVIQGSAADLIKLAMLAIYRRLRTENRRTRMLLQIHDELVFEAPPEEIEEISKMIVEEMARVMELRVPLRVDLNTGRNWAECE